MNTTKLRGVNLGGWLVLERWMTPSLFDGTDAADEYSFMQTPGASEKLERHRQTFITENDFQWLAEHGVNAVRIPIGYWLFDGDPPFTGGISYLDWAMTMAEKYHLTVLIDLHGVKGSQNGKDHSGRIGKSDWFRKKSYRDETIQVLERIAERYKDSPALWGIELLNEPGLGPIKYFILLRSYRQAYRSLARILPARARIVFSDGFVPWLFTGALRRTEKCEPVMAVHWYQFGRVDLERHFARLVKKPQLIARLQRQQPIIIGEWSGMLSHLSLEGVAAEEQAALERRHIKQQRTAYEPAAGWFYWTYKTEQGGIWNFRAQVESGALLL
jgi:glucan 1,3-beta-glucosidase